MIYYHALDVIYPSGRSLGWGEGIGHVISIALLSPYSLWPSEIGRSRPVRLGQLATHL